MSRKVATVALHMASRVPRGPGEENRPVGPSHRFESFWLLMQFLVVAAGAILQCVRLFSGKQSCMSGGEEIELLRQGLQVPPTEEWESWIKNQLQPPTPPPAAIGIRGFSFQLGPGQRGEWDPSGSGLNKNKGFRGLNCSKGTLKEDDVT